MKYKYLFLLLSFILVSPMLSANGLIITNISEVNINKTIGLDKYINFTLTNSEPYSFFNISTSSTYISFDKISQLSTGQSAIITAKIISTQDFIGGIKIRGYYTAQLGALNQTHSVNVNYITGGGFIMEPCTFSVINGDTILWNNLHSYASMKLVNADTSQEISLIQPNSSYQERFDNPLVFNYYFSRYGYPSQVCQIAILDDEGSINNPELDGILDLNIKITYPPTTLIITILDNNYTISPGSYAEDILKIENNGDEIAKNIYLNGDWFTFSSNNFDLAPGTSKNIGYRISPSIFSTNDTNQTYTKNIFVNGNFQTINNSFMINIPYMKISGDYFLNQSTLRDKMIEYAELVRAYCLDYSDDDLCQELNKKVILGGSNSSSSSSLEIAQALIDLMDSTEAFQTLMKTRQDNVETSVQKIENLTTSQDNKLTSIGNKQSSSDAGVIVLCMIMAAIIICGILIYFLKYYKRQNLEREHNLYR